MPPINDHPIVPDHCRASAHAGNNKLFMLPELLSRGHIQLETDESFLHLISSDLQMSLERLETGETGESCHGAGSVSVSGLIVIQAPSSSLSRVCGVDKSCW